MHCESLLHTALTLLYIFRTELTPEVSNVEDFSVKSSIISPGPSSASKEASFCPLSESQKFVRFQEPGNGDSLLPYDSSHTHTHTLTQLIS